jgi:hypothetical protein
MDAASWDRAPGDTRLRPAALQRPAGRLQEVCSSSCRWPGGSAPTCLARSRIRQVQQGHPAACWVRLLNSSARSQAPASAAGPM